MKLAVETTLFKTMSLEKAAESIARCGFKAVEIGLSHFDAVHARRREVGILRDTLSENGLGVSAVFALRELASTEAARRRRAVENMIRVIDNARELECRLIVSELGAASGKTKSQRLAFERSVRSLLPALEERKMVLSFEAHSGDFVERSDDAVDLIGGFESKSIRYLYCIPHTFTLGDDSKKNITYAKGVLNYVHVADSLRPERTFFSAGYLPKVRPHQHLIPGEGDVDFKEVFSALRAIGYHDYLVLDPFSHAENPEYAAKESRRRVRRLERGQGT